jgi:hypothetical protein
MTLPCSVSCSNLSRSPSRPPDQTVAIDHRDQERAGRRGPHARRSVPAERCANCGEGYLTETAAERVEAITEELRAAGVELAVREYEAAA